MGGRRGRANNSPSNCKISYTHRVEVSRYSFDVIKMKDHKYVNAVR